MFQRRALFVAFVLCLAATRARAIDPVFDDRVNYGVGSRPVSSCVADFDGDGDADLATANYYSPSVSILINEGNGTFAPMVNYSVGQYPISVFAYDLDDDGDIDLAVANKISNDVSILMNNGNGTFASAANYSAGITPYSVFASDLDGDGDGDLAVVNIDLNCVSILDNDGYGIFAPDTIYGVGVNPCSIIGSDLDGDGDVDLATTNAASDNISILKNNGDGVFASAVDYTAGDWPRSLCVSDLDGDGDDDLAVTDRYTDEVSILKNNGDGTFPSPERYDVGDDPMSICACDLNRDGFAELAVANSGSDNVTILKNDGYGFFISTGNLVSGFLPYSVCAADFNGDGDSDLAVANFNSDSVSIYINVTPIDVRVIAPNGGEELEANKDYVIRWTIANVTPDSISVLLSLDIWSNYDYTIAAGLANVDSLVWKVAELPSTTARIKVLAWLEGEVGGFDESDDIFTIVGNRNHFVSPTGGNIYPYSKPDWAARSIQDAIDASVAGDSILVSGATYYQTASIVKSIYLLGGWDPSFTTRDTETWETVLSHNGSVVSIFSIASGIPVLDGFTIRNGTGTPAIIPVNGVYGGGVFTYNAPALITNNDISDCGYTSLTGFSAGGAIACYNGTVTITGNTISGCRAQSGGGIYLYLANAAISGNTISGSVPHLEYIGTRNGGGIYALHSTVTMSGNVINGASGYKDGGGVYAKLSPLSTEGDSILSNECLTNGGGIYSERSSLSIGNTVLRGNYAASMGGGIYHRAANFDLENSIVALNESEALGGGIYADSSWGGWTNNTIDRNASLYAGGNVFMSAAVSCGVRNNLITGGAPSGFHATTADNIEFQFNDCFGNLPVDIVTLVADSTNFSRDPRYVEPVTFDYQLGVHSGGIDTGDPSILDTDGSRSDVGAFGGPLAATFAPTYVQGLSVAEMNDTTLGLSWEGRIPGGFDYYAIYSDTTEGFVPDIANFIGTAEASAETFEHSPVSGCRYYRVNIVDDSGYAGAYSNVAGACIEGSTTDAPDLPSLANNLSQNYPNPFNGTTTVAWSLAAPGRGSLKIYDTAGRLVRTLESGRMDAGSHVSVWNGKDDSSRGVASGVYFMRLVAGDYRQTRKIVYLR